MSFLEGIAYPKQVIIASCRNKGKDNMITLSWHTPLSFKPELYCIVVGKERFSHNMVKESKVFCVNFLPTTLEKEMLFCGTKTGRNTDKFKETGLEKEECKRIDCCRIKKAAAYMECKVVSEVDAGDHTLFIGRVVNAKRVKKEKRIFQAENGFTTTVD